MIYMQGHEGLLHARASGNNGPYMIYRQRAPYRYAGSPKDKSPCEQGLLQKMAPTEKATLQTRSPYIQGTSTYNRALQTWGLTDKEFIQTKGLDSKGPL